MTRFYFVTSNDYKFSEFERLFAAHGVILDRANIELEEIQTIDIDRIARDKVIKAYAHLSRPVMVDASGLAMYALKGFPGGLNREFWNVLKDEVCTVASKLGDSRAEIVVALAFCDGKRIVSMSKALPGAIAAVPSTTGTFHLDRVFVPAGEIETLAEMSEVKRDTLSHRALVAKDAVVRIKKAFALKRPGLR